MTIKSADDIREKRKSNYHRPRQLRSFYPDFHSEAELDDWEKLSGRTGFEKDGYKVIIKRDRITVRIRAPLSREIVPVFEVNAVLGSPKYIASLIAILNNIEPLVADVVDYEG